MRTDAAKRKIFFSFYFLGAFAVSCLLSLSNSLRAASVTDSPPASLKNYQTDMPIILQMMKMACSNQQLDEARATIANTTYQKSNALLAGLQSDIQKNTTFLANPAASVQTEIQTRTQQASDIAHGELQAAQDRYEYNQRQFQRGVLGKDVLDKSRRALSIAKAQADSVDEPPSSEVVSETVKARTNSSLSSLKELQAAAHETGLASSQAQGCYLTASGIGIPSTAEYDEKTGSVTSPVTAAPTSPVSSNSSGNAAAASSNTPVSGGAH